MDVPPALDEALRRLFAALEKLEAASERRLRADALRADLEEELAVLQDDRSRLAVELDGALARAATLDAMVDEVSGKIRSAQTAVRDILAAVEDGA